MTNLNSDSSKPAGGKPASAIARGTGWLFRFSMKLLLILIFVGTGTLVGGFFQFSNTVTSSAPDKEIKPAQAVVALTGGANRVSKALDLLAAKKGERLLISGVNEKVNMSSLRKLNASKDALFNCCVDIEKVALDTIGNATETKKWLGEHKYSSLILVTSGYHMPRSLLEFRKLMPETSITAYPVPHKGLQKAGWWKDPEILRLMISEYLKYVGAWTRDHITPKTLGLFRATMGNG